jgi:hypothetical protein
VSDLDALATSNVKDAVWKKGGKPNAVISSEPVPPNHLPVESAYVLRSLARELRFPATTSEKYSLRA